MKLIYDIPDGILKGKEWNLDIATDDETGLPIIYFQHVTSYEIIFRPEVVK